MTSSTLAPFEADILDELLDAQRALDAEPRRPHTHRRVAVALTVAAAVGGTTAVVVAHQSGPTPTRPASSPTAPTAIPPAPSKPAVVLTLAVIKRRAAAQLAHVDNLVVHVRETRIGGTPPGTDVEVYESWWDRGDPEHSRTKYTHNGLPVYDISRDRDGASERYVDFAHRVWYQWKPVSRPGQGHLLGWNPDLIRKLLNDKGLTLVGHETIDGHDTLHLARHDIVFGGELWIDPSTYLIVRSKGISGTTDYTWLPRNAAALAQLVPVAPPGFTFGGLPPDTSTNADGTKG